MSKVTVMNCISCGIEIFTYKTSYAKCNKCNNK